jgi:TatD DNase family protein
MLQAFIAQIQLANELKKPLFLHERSAHADFVEILEKHLGPNTKVCVDSVISVILLLR